jgi:hypothetical protein
MIICHTIYKMYKYLENVLGKLNLTLQVKDLEVGDAFRLENYDAVFIKLQDNLGVMVDTPEEVMFDALGQPFEFSTETVYYLGKEVSERYVNEV